MHNVFLIILIAAAVALGIYGAVRAIFGNPARPTYPPLPPGEPDPRVKPDRIDRR